MKDTKQIIRELVEEVIEEMTGTGAVSIPASKTAFGHDAEKSAKLSMPGSTVTRKTKKDGTSVEETESLTSRRDANIMEAKVDMKGKTCEKCKKGKYTETGVQDDMHGVLHCEKCGHETKRHKEKINEARSRYRNFKESDMMRNETKISYGIREAKKMLREVEYLVSICERLKTECGYSNDNLWERTRGDMVEIHQRLKEIAKRINRMGKQ